MTNKEAIEELKSYKSDGGWGFMCGECAGDCKTCETSQALELAIKALEAQGWIPLTKDTIDRLKDHHWYLITHKDYETPIKAKFHLGGLQHFTWYNGGGIWCCSYYHEGFDNEVLAWMPLPEPYKREETT